MITANRQQTLEKYFRDYCNACEERDGTGRQRWKQFETFVRAIPAILLLDPNLQLPKLEEAAIRAGWLNTNGTFRSLIDSELIERLHSGNLLDTQVQCLAKIRLNSRTTNLRLIAPDEHLVDLLQRSHHAFEFAPELLSELKRSRQMKLRLSEVVLLVDELLASGVSEARTSAVLQNWTDVHSLSRLLRRIGRRAQSGPRQQIVVALRELKKRPPAIATAVVSVESKRSASESSAKSWTSLSRWTTGIAVSLMTVAAWWGLSRSNPGHGSVTELFDKGGLLTGPLFACSVLVIYLTCDRLITLGRCRKQLDQVEGVLANTIDIGGVDAVHKALQTLNGPAAQALGNAVALTGATAPEIDAVMRATLDQEFARIDPRIGWTGTFAAFCPTIGAVGIVIGMVTAFQKVATLGTADPKTAAAGLYVALLTTIFGLLLVLVKPVQKWIDARLEELNEAAQDILAPVPQLLESDPTVCRVA